MPQSNPITSLMAICLQSNVLFSSSADSLESFILELILPNGCLSPLAVLVKCVLNERAVCHAYMAALLQSPMQFVSNLDTL